jgi:hypothetical protein
VSTKIDRIRVQTTVNQDTRMMAAIISMLSSLYSGSTERVLRTVAFHFGFKLERL